MQLVQELCEARGERSLVIRKAAAIIACYLDSQIPPAIQVSVDQEIVQAVLQQQLHASPTLFRDAQVTPMNSVFLA